MGAAQFMNITTQKAEELLINALDNLKNEIRTKEE